MGMDVIGIKPTASQGEHFRNSVWWWPLLWQFACDIAGVSKELQRDGQFNDGDGLGEAGAAAMATALRQALADGRVNDFQRDWHSGIASAPDEICQSCAGACIRDQGADPVPCGACSGTGKKRPFWTDYRFDRENVEKFADFLEHCGGFLIC